MKQFRIGFSVVVRIIAFLICIGFALAQKYIFTPALSFISQGFWWYLVFVFAISTVIFLVIESINESFIFTLILVIIASASFVITLILMLLSGTLFNAKSYSSLITIDYGNFNTDIEPIEDANSLPVLDIESASILGSRSVGSLERISQYSVNSEYNMILYNNEEYRVTPLEYDNFIKANKSSSYGIPGYILINASNSDIKLVTKYTINYSPSGVFSHNLKRYLRSIYPKYIFGKAQFDIDDNGVPYYIVPVLTPTIKAFGGKVVTSFIVVNATNGEHKEYLQEDLPDWIDHAYGLDYLMNLVSYKYELSDGFWNSSLFGSKTDVKKLSYQYRGTKTGDDEENAYFYGYNSLNTADGIQFFTCVTSANDDESAIGFILANPRTGEVKLYFCNGAEASTAQKQAEALVQNYRYSSSYPLITNVDGVPTYVLSLKDKLKNNVAYVMLKFEDYRICAKGNSLSETLELYKKTLSSKSKVSSNGKNVEASISDTSDNNTDINSQITGVIAELYTAIKDGNTCYFIQLNDNEDLYVSPLDNNSFQVKLKVGDTVTMDYYKSSEDGVKIVSKITID